MALDLVVWFLAILGALVVVVAIFAVLVSLPGIGRYLRIRRM